MSAMQKTPWGDLPIAPRGAAAPVADLFALPENAALLLALVACWRTPSPSMPSTRSAWRVSPMRPLPRAPQALRRGAPMGATAGRPCGRCPMNFCGVEQQ